MVCVTLHNDICLELNSNVVLCYRLLTQRNSKEFAKFHLMYSTQRVSILCTHTWRQTHSNRHDHSKVFASPGTGYI